MFKTILSTLIALSLTMNPIESIEYTKDKEITISFVGDCTLGEYKGQGAGNQFKDYYNSNGPDYFFKNVVDIFNSDDFTFINLEGPLTNNKQTANKQFPIKGAVENINILVNSSIEVCNLANNHIYDCGTIGIEDTVNILKSNNIGYCGENYYYQSIKNNVQVGFLGYRAWNNTDELLNKIKLDIDNTRASGADIVCVMFHWGNEREYYSNSVQESIAHFTIDSGADIVVGGHPHVIQGIEKYKGKTIVYSLGNFSFGANKNPSDKDTFIFQQTFKVTDDNTVEYKDYNIIPCSISSESNRNNYQPTPLTDNNAIRVIDRLKKYSEKYLETIF